jgi:pimeloyl-ACP methyl ester carboxylesterase
MELAYQTFGSGAPVLVLHGLFGSRDNWNGINKKLAQEYQVFAVDMRNHGDSPHSDEFTYEVMAADLLELMQTHELPATYLLGHSMGGKAAMRFAFDHPEIVNRLVIVDIAPKSYPPHHDEILDALNALDLTQYTTRQELDAGLAHYLDNYGVRQFLLKSVTRDANGAFAWKMNLDVITRDYDRLLEGVDSPKPFDKPTLFIRGATSDYIQDEDEALIIRLFPQARIATIPNAGHWVHAEAPGVCLELIRAFLSAEG